jgi:hypothetical protein
MKIMEKEGSVTWMTQAIALPLFFAISYIIQGKFYLNAVKEAHQKFGDLMAAQSRVFISEYWLHLLSHYVLPMAVISLLGAACANVLWTKRSYIFFMVVNFIFWPKVKMDSPELSFTILFFAIMLISAALMPNILQRVLKKIKNKRAPKLELEEQNLEGLESA